MSPGGLPGPVGGRRVLAVLLLAALLFALSQTLVLPALSAIGVSLGADRLATSWVLTAFLLSASVATPVVGRLGDRYDKKRVLAGVLVVFSVGTVVCALASDIGVLIAGRALMGIAGGVLPLAFGIARDALPAAQVPGALSALSAVIGVGAGIGLPLSGLVVDRVDIAWLFWITLPALPVAGLVLRWVPPSPPGDGGRVDWAGAALLAAALVFLLLAVTQAPAWGWTSPAMLGSAAAGVVLLVVWVRLESRVASPLVALRTLRRRAVLGADTAGFTIGFALFAGFLLIPQIAQVASPDGLGESATVAGLLLLPSALAQLVAAPVATRLGARRGYRVVLLLGAGLVAAAFALLAALHTAAWQLAGGGAVMGLGVGLVFAALANIIVGDVPPHEVGVATGLNVVARTLGGAVGAAIATVVLTAATDTNGQVDDSGFTAAFVLAAAAALAGSTASLLVPPRPPMKGNG